MSSYKKRRIVSIGLFLTSFSVYLKTLTPTIYAGDPSEFAATSYLLDISHPPGYPLYNLLSKLFTYLPIGNVAFRVNMFSGFFAALTVLMIYLIVLKVSLNLKPLIPSTKSNFRLTLPAFDTPLNHLPPLVAALMLTFSYTLWQHSVKAEVYTLYLFLVSTLILILLKWKEKKDTNYLYLFSLTFGLTASSHLLVFPLASAFLFYIIISNYRVLTSRKNLLIMFFLFLLPLSFYLYLPLRSAAEPLINWGRPQAFQQFKYMLLLKEQGMLFDPLIVESEWEAIFSNQILLLLVTIISRILALLPLYLAFALILTSLRLNKRALIRIFFLLAILTLIWGCFWWLSSSPHLKDFSLTPFKFLFSGVIILCLIIIFFALYLAFFAPKKVIPAVLSFLLLLFIFTYCLLLKFSPPYIREEFSQFIYLEYLAEQFTILGLFLGTIGVIYFIKKDKELFFFLLFLFILPTIFLILYIFPDNSPLMQERFSLPAYLILSIFIGLGMRGIMETLVGAQCVVPLIKDRIKAQYIMPLLSLFILIPLIPAGVNYKRVDKSKYYFTLDYGENILSSLPQDTIILAKGIDTIFPLWYLNFVEKRREDVTLIYADALSQNWYIKGIKKWPKLKVSYPGGLKDRSKERSKFIENIVTENIKSSPLYYTSTDFFIPKGIREGYVALEGVVFRVLEKRQKGLSLEEIEELRKALDNYSYRGVDNSSIFKDLEAKRVLSVYGNAYGNLAGMYLKGGRTDEALNCYQRAVKYNPQSAYLHNQLAGIYFQRNEIEKAKRELKKAISANPQFAPPYFNLGIIYLMEGERDKALSSFKKVLEIEPENKGAEAYIRQILGEGE